MEEFCPRSLGKLPASIGTAERNKPEGFTIWMTGLPGSGKSTLAGVLKKKFETDYDRFVEVLDGDEIRKGLSRDSASQGRTEKSTRGECRILRRCFPETE